MKLDKTLKVCLMIVILLLFCFTPLGTIPLGPVAATLCMIPVATAAIVFGIKVGALMGFIFAVCSFIFFTFIAPAAPTAFLFTPFAESGGYKGNLFSLFVCFIPRIFAGMMPVLVSDILCKKTKMNMMSYSIASFCGSMTNTILFILLAFMFFGNDLNRFAVESGMVRYATQSELVNGVVQSNVMSNMYLPLILGMTFFTNGIPEAIICAIVCPPIVKILRKI